MGYVESVYVKEDHVGNIFCRMWFRDWERGIHILVGKKKFLGGGWHNQTFLQVIIPEEIW